MNDSTQGGVDSQPDTIHDTVADADKIELEFSDFELFSRLDLMETAG